MIRLVDFSRQNKFLKKQLKEAIFRIIDDQAYILGHDVELFEREFAAYCGTSQAVGVASGFDAILLSLRALKVGGGDEVITTANTFISTVLPILHLGAKPILVDADRTTLSIDVSLVEKHISPRTRVIIPVHLFGLPVDMNALLSLAKKYNLFIIEDACQAHGALYKGRAVGSLGDIGCFSFYPSKNLGAFGDGGAVITNNKNLSDTIRMLRNVGQKEKNVHEIIGYNSRLDTIQAAILRTKLPHLQGWIQRRRGIASYYTSQLQGLPIVLPNEPNYALASYHLYVIRTKYRDQLERYLQHNNIACGIHYPTPIHLQPCMRTLGYRKGDFPVSEESAQDMLSLPLYPELTQREAHTIILYIRKFFHRSSQT